MRFKILIYAKNICKKTQLQKQLCFLLNLENIYQCRSSSCSIFIIKYFENDVNAFSKEKNHNHTKKAVCRLANRFFCLR